MFKRKRIWEGLKPDAFKFVRENYVNLFGGEIN